MVNGQTSHPAKVAPAGVDLRCGGAVVPAFCRRMALQLIESHGIVRCCTVPPIPNQRLVSGGRGAVGRALCFRNRAMRPCFAPGLLRGATAGDMVNGTDVNRGLPGSGDALGVGAGASAIRVLIRSKRAPLRASPTQRGRPAPAPCDNELPSHAPNPFDRPILCLRLYARSAGRGDEELRL